MSYSTWKAANDIQEALEEGNILWIPINKQLTDEGDVLTFPAGEFTVSHFGTPPS